MAFTKYHFEFLRSFPIILLWILHKIPDFLSNSFHVLKMYFIAHCVLYWGFSGARKWWMYNKRMQTGKHYFSIFRVSLVKNGKHITLPLNVLWNWLQVLDCILALAYTFLAFKAWNSKEKARKSAFTNWFCCQNAFQIWFRALFVKCSKETQCWHCKLFLLFKS